MPYITRLRSKFAAEGRLRNVVFGPRRSEHGAVALTGENELWQPQDGAADMESQVAQMPAPRSRGPFARLNEPEDAGLTGATRSLGRRLLGLNVVSPPKPVARETAQAKRRSFTGGQPQVA